MATYTFVTIYTPPTGAVVVHSWGPYGTRREAISAASKMRRRHQKENAWMKAEHADIANKRLTIHTQVVADPFEVQEQIEGKLVITERSIPDLTPLKNAQAVVLAAAVNWRENMISDDANLALKRAVDKLKAL